MQRFFDSLEAIHRFTLNLAGQGDRLVCPHCHQSHHFISHGFIHKHGINGQTRRCVGKRIVCSNRYGHLGCGRTQRLGLACELRRRRYDCAHVFVFLCALIQGCCIRDAYQQATHTHDPRHAYRWLDRLQHRLMVFRQVLPRTVSTTAFDSRCHRLRLLLPTLQPLFHRVTNCAGFQQHAQANFM